jgi:arylsulfatase A-like enzyme
MPSGSVDESMVNLIDIVPTLLRLQDIAVPPSMHGLPLPTINDAKPRDETFSEYGAGGRPFSREELEGLPKPYGRRTIFQSLEHREAEGRRKMVRTRTWKYVHDPMGDLDELYDLKTDPGELHNCISDPAYEGIVSDLSRRLLDWSIRTEDARAVPLPDYDQS